MDIDNIEDMDNQDGSEACVNALEQAMVACASKVISYLNENETKRAKEVADAAASIAAAWAELNT